MVDNAGVTNVWPVNTGLVLTKVSYQLKVTVGSVEDAVKVAVWPAFTVVDEACTCGSAGNGLTVTFTAVLVEPTQDPFAAST